jgi:hypothetical protein
MGKAIKAFLFINLLLSAVVLTFGVMVFRNRGVVKSRTLLLEKNVADLSRNLNWGGDVAWETAGERKLTAFTVPQPAQPMDIPTLGASLNELAGFATTRVSQLSQRYVELVQTRNTLADTEERLAARTRELATATAKIANLKDTLASTQNDLREANRRIETLRAEKAALETRMEELNTEIRTLNDRIATQEIDLEQSIQRRDKTSAEYDRCRIGAAGGGKNVRIRGTPARVLDINPEWNYVVINKGAIDNVEPFTEALIHRGNQYVGRVTVMRVEGTVSVAEIQRDSLIDGASIVAGDTLFF